MTKNDKKYFTIFIIGFSIVALLTGISFVVVKDITYKANIIETLTSEVARQEHRIKLKDAELKELSESNAALSSENTNMKREIESLKEEVSRKAERTFQVEVTAYTLGGRTATGMSLSGHTLESARAIAVDPGVIPLGSDVRLRFHDPNYQQYNGIYTAVDTGGAISGHRIDLFMGHGNDVEALEFGRRMATVEIL